MGTLLSLMQASMPGPETHALHKFCPTEEELAVGSVVEFPMKVTLAHCSRLKVGMTGADLGFSVLVVVTLTKSMCFKDIKSRGSNVISYAEELAENRILPVILHLQGR